MPARTGCCATNFAKLDPATGAIVWNKRILGNAVAPAYVPAIYRVEPLRGTNDMLVTVSDGANGASLCRVDSSGNQVWFYHGVGGAHIPTSQTLPIYRIFGSDGTTIVCLTSPQGVSYTDGLVGLDYNGNVLWTQALSQESRSLLVSPTGALIGYGQFTTPTQNTFTLLTSLTGALISQGNPSVFGSPYPQAVNQVNGNFLIPQYTSTAPGIYNPGYTLLGSFTIAGFMQCGRWEGGGISVTYGASNKFMALFNPTTSTILWTNTTFLGSTFDQIFDSTNDSSGAYFAGISSGVPANIVKFVTAGTLSWAQYFIWNTATRSYTINGIAVSGDGYIYCGGG